MPGDPAYALLSRGVYHSDEHYQILEYAHMKLFGTPTVDHLAWEYPLQMRSGVQPFVAWFLVDLFRGLTAAGIWSPWLAVTLLQLLSALLSVVVMLSFGVRCAAGSPKHRASGSC